MLVVVIPAYQPDQTLLEVARQLDSAIADRPFPKLLVVDDGSTTPTASEVMAVLREMTFVRVLTHDVNRGKGAALKTAFAHVLDTMASVTTVVTADADGQHLASDIVQVGAEGEASGETVLGVRNFGGDVPLRSRLGNKLTRTLLRAFLGHDISDTQTGLRALPRSTLPGLLSIRYDRYNFEFEALIALARTSAIRQHPIATVYEPGNPTSHFNPLLDSARIYAVLVRHVSLIALVAIADIVLFAFFSASGMDVLPSLLCARAITTVIYFGVAREIVFRSKGNRLGQIALFLLLVAGNIALLTPFIATANSQLGIPKPVAMVVGNIFLFVSNFLWQNYIIFSRSGQDQ